MTSNAQSWQPDWEKQLLESLRTRYEDQGFTFMSNPAKSELPDFFGTYLPDAVARKPGQNVAIEVKFQIGQSTERSLQQIRRLLQGHEDWQLHVVLAGSGPGQSTIISAAAPATIRERIAEVRTLSTDGHRGAAFVMAWSLLEAALRAVDERRTDVAYTPGTVVQTLASRGYIDPQFEKRMRDLISVRNRVVHGDVDIQPSADEIEIVLSAVEETLRVAAFPTKPTI